MTQEYNNLLRLSEPRFRTIFESAATGIALVDQECRILESNRALQEILGYDHEELLYKEFTAFIRLKKLAGWNRLFQDLQQRNASHIEWKSNISVKTAARNGAAC